MNKIFFTSDTHFGHANIIKYSKARQQFLQPGDIGSTGQWTTPAIAAARCHEMDEELIRRWNAVVGKEDTVYHLGDFCFKDFMKYFSRLNGMIIFVEGNHDKVASQHRNKFAGYHKLLEINIYGQLITLCHYAMRIWNQSHRGAWHLYGHSHDTLPDLKDSLSFDVGVDSQSLQPLEFPQVTAIMAIKSGQAHQFLKNNI